MLLEVRIDLDLVAAQNRGERDQSEGEAGEPARTVEHDVRERHAARDHHRHQHHVAQHGYVVALAQLGRGQILRKVKRQYPEEAQAAQREGDDAGDQSPAFAKFAVAFCEIVEFFKHECARECDSRLNV